MKLIIKEYLLSLRERGELDVILPDLLSQMGLNVFSRPNRGTRQYGVDVAAVGQLKEGLAQVYLFSIKSGDLRRQDWDGEPAQSLRPSLNEIIDVYIPNHIPTEHREKRVVICICIGGEIRENIRQQVSGFTESSTTDKITFEEWNGDKLAELIQNFFFREELLPPEARSNLRKSIALLDEPETSYKYFTKLITSLSNVKEFSDDMKLRAIRQIAISLWILFAWSRNAEHMESAYLSGEFALLHAWNIFKEYQESEDHKDNQLGDTFYSIYITYQKICDEFLYRNVVPYVGIKHGISHAVQSISSIDINIKLFDLLGRLAIDGIWSWWYYINNNDLEEEIKSNLTQEIENKINEVKKIIINNEALLLPIKDNQAIDIFMVLFLLSLRKRNSEFQIEWLRNMLANIKFAYLNNSYYPSILTSYSDILTCYRVRDEKYREEVTAASILYPVIALWTTFLEEQELFNRLAEFKQEHLQHCNFQYWFVDQSSEEHYYINSDVHGATLTNLSVEQSQQQFLQQVFIEAEQSSSFEQLSAIKAGWWPIILVASRHYRLPVPVQLVKDLRPKEEPAK